MDRTSLLIALLTSALMIGCAVLAYQCGLRTGYSVGHSVGYSEGYEELLHADTSIMSDPNRI